MTRLDVTEARLAGLDKRLRVMADEWDSRANDARQTIAAALAIGYAGALNDCALQLRAALGAPDA